MCEETDLWNLMFEEEGTGLHIIPSNVPPYQSLTHNGKETDPNLRHAQNISKISNTGMSSVQNVQCFLLSAASYPGVCAGIAFVVFLVAGSLV